MHTIDMFDQKLLFYPFYPFLLGYFVIIIGCCIFLQIITQYIVSGVYASSVKFAFLSFSLQM